jgi:hypothetical protein
MGAWIGSGIFIDFSVCTRNIMAFTGDSGRELETNWGRYAYTGYLYSVAVGLPYFLLSTNGPIMQSWFYRSRPQQSSYWLYALSNIGSLMGLLVYPFFIEPNFPVKFQGWVWSGGYYLFVLLAGVGVYKTYRANSGLEETFKEKKFSLVNSLPSRQLHVIWVILSMVASIMLLATTSQITQEVAPTPFLWVLPLAIYLLSFIITYSGERWYNRKLYGLLFVVASAGFIWALADEQAQFLPLVVVYCFLLFVTVMICNGEIYKLRPAPIYLTRFYLMTSVGGVMGGIAVNLIAPFVFKGYWELPISFGLTWAVVLAFFITRKSTQPTLRVNFIHNVLVGGFTILAGAASLFGLAGGRISDDIFAERNYYGVVRVKEVFPDDPVWRGYKVVHGITIHGLQFTAADKRYSPTVYFSEQSGVGLAIKNHPKYGQGMRVGVLGLGIGTLAAYGLPGDVYRMYEINPIMIDLAQGKNGYFNYLKDSQAQIIIIEGDARISLERELTGGSPGDFDLLVLDVFSSDSIPVHLLTKEAFEIYLRHLSMDGLVAANISNRHLDLIPVLWKLSKNFNLSMLVIPNIGDGKVSFPSNWVLLSRNPRLLQSPAMLEPSMSLVSYSTNIPLWTDDFNNLLQILR